MGFSRKFLSPDGLIKVVKHCFLREKFQGYERSEYSWQDCLMSGLAIFGLKMPSLLQFDKEMKDSESLIKRNLKKLYGVDKAPSDTTLRERLDQLSPQKIRRAFKQIFAHLQRGKVLEKFRYWNGYHIAALDGTGQFSSEKIHCENCCEKNHRNGKKSYYHQMLGAVLLHPDRKEVIPLAPEPIVKGDGFTKNDCERNAAKRLLSDLRREHPHFKLLIVEDGLGSNFPHLSLLDSLGMAYVIGVKPGDHDYLFDWIKHDKAKTYQKEDSAGTQHHFASYYNVPLNDKNQDYRVNVIVYTEIKKSGKQQRFSWVTQLPITDDNVYELMRAGRARWRIENETFNTLKNQGYHFEHNYGHGNKNLCSVMTMLMMLAFLMDQVKQVCCKTYQQAKKQAGRLSMLFEKTRALIDLSLWESWEKLYHYMAYRGERGPPLMNGLVQVI